MQAGVLCFRTKDKQITQMSHKQEENIMHQYRVTLRVDFGRSKTVDVMADGHWQANLRAKRQHNLVVLSTEFIA
jgi:hypothetical protein